MNEQAKIVFYKQLMKVEIVAKMKKENELMDWEDFIKLDDAEAFKYAINYRNEAYEKFCEKKSKIKDKDKKPFYLEIPDINLENKDLSGIYLNMFMIGYSKERNNGKMIFKTSEVNLKNTNCVINMATIFPIIVSDDGVNIKEITADITKCDFRGCKVFGKFQNTKAKLNYNEENLPKEYIDRLEKYKILPDVELTTDYVYLDMLEKKIIRGMSGLDKVKQMVDYDLSTIGKGIWKYRDVIMENPINISYTGAFIEEKGLDSIGKENYYIDLETRARDAYLDNNIEELERLYERLDKETKRKIMSLALRDEKCEFVKKHQKDLSGMQKKYIDLQKQGQKATEEENKLRERMRQEYKDGNSMDLVSDLMNTTLEIRSEMIDEFYKLGDLQFVESCLNEIDPKLKNDIFVEEYRKNNRKFLYDNFDKLDDGELKDRIVKEEWKNRNENFLYANYHIIENESIRTGIMKMAFDTENKKFIRKNFDDLPKNLQIESIIKFKDLGIPESKMLELLK